MAEPARTLLELVRDLQRVSDCHGEALRDGGLDDLADGLEGLVASARAGADELGAALQPLPGEAEVSRREREG